MDLKQIHDLVYSYLKKAQGQHISHPEIDAFLDRAQIQYMDKIKPAYSANQQLDDALQPFKVKKGFTNSDTAGGLYTLPYDYQHLLSIETTVMDDGHTIYPMAEKIGEDELGYRKSSQLIPISVKNPIFIQSQKKIQFYPDQSLAGTMYYIRRPLVPKFVYTMNGRQMVYDEFASVQLEWDEPSIEKVIMIALQLIGVVTDDDKVVQLGVMKSGGNNG